MNFPSESNNLRWIRWIQSERLYTLLSKMGELSRNIPQIAHGFFHRNRIDTDRSPPLVELYKSTLPVFRSNKLGYDWNLFEQSTLKVFRWKARGYDWNLVDSIGQPSVFRK